MARRTCPCRSSAGTSELPSQIRSAPTDAVWSSTRRARFDMPCPSSAGTSDSSITVLVGTDRPNLFLALDSHNWVRAFGRLLRPIHGSLRPAIHRYSFDAKFCATQRASVFPAHIDLSSATIFGMFGKTTGSPSRTITTLTADSLSGDRVACVNSPHHTDAADTGRLLLHGLLSPGVSQTGCLARATPFLRSSPEGQRGPGGLSLQDLHSALVLELHLRPR